MIFKKSGEIMKILIIKGVKVVKELDHLDHIPRKGEIIILADGTEWGQMEFVYEVRHNYSKDIIEIELSIE